MNAATLSTACSILPVASSDLRRGGVRSETASVSARSVSESKSRGRWNKDSKKMYIGCY